MNAPTAYVRALDLGVERLEQQYTRLPTRARVPATTTARASSDLAGVLVYDQFGLLAVRVS
jgi:hypothetical protein